MHNRESLERLRRAIPRIALTDDEFYALQQTSMIMGKKVSPEVLDRLIYLGLVRTALGGPMPTDKGKLRLAIGRANPPGS